MAHKTVEIPKANWVRLEIEPVQVNADEDTTLNFATVQSVVPGAHGLYYRDSGERKALLFDNNTGKVFPPPNGWESVPVYIHLAHGSRHGTHFADYTKANEAFEKNISAVEKLFAAAGLGKPRQSLNTSKTRARSTSKKNRPKSGFEAQPEIVNISEESEGAAEKAEKQTAQLERLRLKNEELKSRVKEYKSELAAANQKIRKYRESEEKEKSSEHSEDDSRLNKVVEELRQQLAENEIEKKKLNQKLNETEELLKKSEVNVDQNDSKNPVIRSLEVKLQMASNSIRQLENEKQQLQEAQRQAFERIEKLQNDNNYLKSANDQLTARANESTSEKLLKQSEQRVWEINDEKSKLEWRVAELTQWWNDAKWKIGELESSIAHQRCLLSTATGKIQNLNEQNQGVINYPIDGFTLSQSHIGKWQLGNNNGAQIMHGAAIPSIPVIPTYSTAAGAMMLPGNDERSVTLSIPNTEGEVFVTGSFVNWKCTLKCNPLSSGKSGVTLNLARGRHEFRFMINGQWVTSSDYQQVPNGLGGQNNLIFVD